MVRRRVRIRFRKEGDLRLIGHLDLVRAWERLFRRAELRLVMTEGFHPRPRIGFPSALPMGETGLDEIVEADFDCDQTLAQVRAAIDRCAPEGLTTTGIEELSPGATAAQVREVAYEFPLPAEREAEVKDSLARLLTDGALPVARAGGRTIDLRAMLLEAHVASGVLRFRMRVTLEANLRARDVLAALGLADLDRQGPRPTRTHVLLEPDGRDRRPTRTSETNASHRTLPTEKVTE
ncbi:MAG: DUF2344 domain-containing protein [Planctomycetia bacterium]|nr:DUF2344 domain-containing protein [Planctomycetia bacterium]